MGISVPACWGPKNDPNNFCNVVVLDAGWPVIAHMQALVVVLALSVAGNALLGRAWLSARDDLAAATVQRDDARTDATACSDATEDLRDLADKRNAESAPARAAAAAVARTLTRRADATLASAPAVPGDMCASMQDLGDAWLQGKGAP